MDRNSHFLNCCKILNYWLIAICFFTITSCNNQNLEAKLLDQKVEVLPQIIDNQMSELKIPGIQLCYFNKSQILFEYKAGVVSSESKKPIQLTTQMEAASLSKPVFVFLLQSLINKEELDNDFMTKPLIGYIDFETIETSVIEPRYRSLKEYLTFSEKYDSLTFSQITAAQILRHSTGMGNWWDSLPSIDPEIYKNQTIKYSDDAYLYLQRVVEHILKKSLSQLLEEHIPSEVAEMKHFTKESISADRAWGHNRAGELHRDIWAAQEALAHGTLLCTARAYAQFVQLIVKENQLPNLSEKVKITSTSELYWSRGWGLEKLTSEDSWSYWHWGNDVYYQNFVWYIPKLDRGIVVMTNSQNGLKLIDKLFSELFESGLEASEWSVNY